MMRFTDVIREPYDQVEQKQPPELFYKKRVLEIFAKFTEACNFIKIETLAQVFSCEFCEIFNNAFFFTELLQATTVKQKFTGKWEIISICNSGRILDY